MSGTPVDPRYQVYRDAIRRHVCAVCLDGRDDGTCGLGGRVCAVEAHLPGLVGALLSLESSRMDEYIDAIKAQVCSGCTNQDSEGRCMLRDSGDCALMAYLPLVLDAVEEVRDAFSKKTP